MAEARRRVRRAARAGNFPGMHIWLIDKPDAVQTQIRVGKLGIRRGDPNYIPVVVMNRIFGGGYNSRLNTEVRVKKGLTYDAHSSFNPHRFAGSFAVATYTRTAATVEATKLVVDLISQMSTGDVTPKEMDFARDYLAGVYPIQSETAEQVANRVLTVAAFDLPADYNSTYPDKIRGVTSAQVREMAQRYLATKDLDMVLAGNVGAFRDALEESFPGCEVRGNSIRPGGRACSRFAQGEARRSARRFEITGARLLHRQDHFPDVLPVVNVLMRGGGLIERKCLADHGFDLARAVHPE